MARRSKTTPSEKDQLAEDWIGRIRRADEWTEENTTRRRWPEFRSAYRCNWPTDILPVNMTYSFGRTMIPSVYFRAPRVVISPTRPEFAWHAAIIEAIDNWLIKELLLKETLKAGALDSYLCGTAPIKLGYDSEFGFLPQQAAYENSQTVTQVSVKTGDKIEYNAGVKPGMPWALPCYPEDIIVPPGYRSPYGLPWVSHRYYRSLEDVRNDQKYNPKRRQEVNGTKVLRLTETDRMRFGKPYHDEEQICEIFEVEDVRTGKLMVFCENMVLVDAQSAMQIDGLPYEFITFNPDPLLFWGIPDAHILSFQQKEANDTKTQEMYHRAISLIKFLIKKGSFDKAELKKLLSEYVGPAVEVEDDNILSAVQILQPHIPPEFAAYVTNAKSDAREALGFSSNQLGDFSPYHGKSAAESMIVNQSSDMRNNERKDVIGDVLRNIIRKWNQMIFKFWTQDRVIQIVGPQGAPYWIQYTGEQLTGEYFIDIDVESAMPISHGTKLQMMEKLMGQFNGDPMIDQMKLRKLYLRQYDQVDQEFKTILNQVPPGVAQQVAAQRQPGPQYIGGGGQGGGAGAPPGSRAGQAVGGPQRGQVYNIDQMGKANRGRL